MSGGIRTVDDLPGRRNRGVRRSWQPDRPQARSPSGKSSRRGENTTDARAEARARAEGLQEGQEEEQAPGVRKAGQDEIRADKAERQEELQRERTMIPRRSNLLRGPAVLAAVAASVALGALAGAAPA